MDETREPPEILQDMRLVSQGLGRVRTAQQQWLEELRQSKPAEFLSRLLAAEKDWLAVAEKAEAPGTAPEKDQGTERVMELLDAEWRQVEQALQGLPPPEGGPKPAGA